MNQYLKEQNYEKSVLDIDQDLNDLSLLEDFLNNVRKVDDNFLSEFFFEIVNE